MSAFMCDVDHLLHLAFAMCERDRHGSSVAAYFGAQISVQARKSRLQWESANDRDRIAAVFDVLAFENMASLKHRYPRDAEETWTLPLMTAQDFLRVQSARYRTRPTHVQMFKSIQCYEYQACEHDAWPESLAFKLCRSLESALIQSLPGYDAANWGAPSQREEPVRHA